MNRRSFRIKSMLSVAAGVLALAVTPQADAGWHSVGGSYGGYSSYGGSSGGYTGSYGGSYGSYRVGYSSFGGSSGGGLLSRLHNRIHSRLATRRAYYGSSGGSSGGYVAAYSYGGSHGGSYGSYYRSYRYGGSHGGSYGSSYRSYRTYGSYGGSLGGSYRYRTHRTYGGSAGGSYGSYQSYTPSYSYGTTYVPSYGGSTGGSYSTYGSSTYVPQGQVIESHPVVPYTSEPATSTPQSAPASQPTPAEPASETRLHTDDGRLTIRTNDGAKIFVNGMLTKSTGDTREYVSHGLTLGYDYTYRIQAEWKQGDDVKTQDKTVVLQAGQTVELDLLFDDSRESDSETTLTLNVPENATVYLAGNATSASGATRVFTTTALPEGAKWENYEVRVTLEQDGRLLSQHKSITLNAGETQSLSFDFDASKVAAR